MESCKGAVRLLALRVRLNSKNTFLFFTVIIHMHTHGTHAHGLLCHSTQPWRSEDRFHESVSSFHHTGHGDLTQKFNINHLYPLSHLTSSSGCSIVLQRHVLSMTFSKAQYFKLSEICLTLWDILCSYHPWLLLTKLQRVLVCEFWYEHMLSLLLNIYLGLKLPGHVASS